VRASLQKPLGDALGLTALTGALAVAISAAFLSESLPADASPSGAEALDVPPIEPPPLLLRPIETSSAIALNRKIPFASGPNPPAYPFRFRGDEQARERALECLTMAIYYEAGNEPLEGQRAVAQVVLNRVRHPAFPASICAVVFQGASRTTGCQFTFTCDGSLARRPSSHGWQRARAVASEALSGAVFEPVGFATHYHANYVAPYWATTLAKNRVLGAHIFYRWPGGWGRPTAFTQAYLAREADPCLIHAAAASIARRSKEDQKPADIADQRDVTVAVDPRVELISIVRFLAAGSPSNDETGYQHQVRRHFSRFSDHLAVQIYRQLVGSGGGFTLGSALRAALHDVPQPTATFQPLGSVDAGLVKAFGGAEKLEGFRSALREFALHSDFQKFLAERQGFYQDLASQGRGPAIRLSAGLTEYTGMPAADVPIILAPLLKDDSSGLYTRSGEEWLIVGAAGGAAGGSDGQAALERALAIGLAKRNLQSVIAANGVAAAREDLLSSIAERARLSAAAPAAGRNAEGATAQRELVARLRMYEENRERYASIGDFFPVLLARSAGSAKILHLQMLRTMPGYCGATRKQRIAA
jgi:hypothetical protein